MAYTITKLLKQGDMSKVYLAEREGDVKHYIFKIINLKDRYSEDEIEYIHNTTELLLKQLPVTKGLLGYKRSTLNNNNLIVLSEYFRSITLDQFIQRKKAITEKDIWNIFLQIIETLYQLARNELYLVNIRNDNIFINDKLEIKFNYLSLTKLLHFENFVNTEDTEMKSCVFSLGYILLDLVNIMINSTDYERSSYISEELKTLISLCTIKDGKMRPSVYDVYYSDIIKLRMDELLKIGNSSRQDKTIGNSFSSKTVDINNKFFGYPDNLNKTKQPTFYNSIINK
jgi:serine/threonine protein kinase